MIPTLVCGCGCGMELRRARYPSQQPRYVTGHFWRGKSRPGLGAKVSASLSGRARTAEHCRNISLAKRGKKQGPMSAARRRAISDSLTGRRLSDETRAKLSRAARSRLPLGAKHHDEYQAIHKWLKRTFPKVGACGLCGQAGRTDYAFLWHPDPHTWNRDDYIELCHSGCHQHFDLAVRGMAA